jgi:hypothetical protein
MQRDRYGLSLSTASEAAASAYRDGFDRLLAAWNGAEEALDRAIASDPNFALAHIARARMYAVFGHGAEARACATRARNLAAKTTERERGHVHVIASAIEGKAAQALADAERHVDVYPRDALVLVSLLGAFGLYAFSGRNDHDEARLSICRRLAAHYGDDWWFLAYLGWSNIEAGYPGIGIEQAQRALTLRGQNGHVAHILAHGYFEAGDAAAGNQFLSGWLGEHPRSGFMHWHLAWHRALLDIEVGDNDAALRTFQDQIRPSVSDAPPINVLSDGASFPASRLGRNRRLRRPARTRVRKPFHRSALCARCRDGRPGAIRQEGVGARSASGQWSAGARQRRNCDVQGRTRHGGRRQRRGDSHPRAADARRGPHRWEPCSARIVGRHADRGLPAERRDWQGARSDQPPSASSPFGARSQMARYVELNRHDRIRAAEG